MTGHDRAGGVDLPEVSRRGALTALAGTAATLGGAKAADNVLVGYGVLTGTNLVDQDLGPLLRERFGPTATELAVPGATLGYRDGRVVVSADGATRDFPVTERGATRAADADRDLGLDGRLERLVADLVAVRSGEFRFEIATLPSFLERLGDAVSGGTARPETVGALRGNRFAPADRDVVNEFTGVTPAETTTLLHGLADGFREHTTYDFARYAAGSVEDNLLFGAGDLRAPFRSPTSFEAMLDGRSSGLFCYDFAYRSIEALHAVPAVDQALPVAGAVVTDSRHKHVYTGVASAVRVDGDLVVPATFVDYMHSTQYDDLHLRDVLGEGVNAYDRRHRTDGVYWNRYARW